MERIRKINIEGLINLLNVLYDKGVDYVDISGRQNEGEGEDILGLSFCKEYMDPEYKEYFDDMEDEDLMDETSEESNIEVKLSDDDLNQLI